MASLIQTLAVAEYLNFRHAANALGVSQSSVSMRIKTLEEDLGVLLFERHARGVRLTDAGRRFVEKVAAGVDQLDDAVKTAGMTARGEIGPLRIDVHALIPGGFLTDLISLYRERHPSIDLSITEGATQGAMAQLRAGRLDVIFMANVATIPDCHSRQMWAEQLLVALPESHRFAKSDGIAWSDLAGEMFLVRHGGAGPQVHDHIVLRLVGHWLNPSIIRFDVERATLLSMVAEGFGVTIVCDASARALSPGVVFVPILDEPELVAFSGIWSPHNRSPALSNLLSLAGQMSRSTRQAC